jgi:pyruvate-formate lyase-activating enzyme
MLRAIEAFTRSFKNDGLRDTLVKASRALCRTVAGNQFVPLAPPTAIAIELTSKCNLRCAMCARHSRTPGTRTARQARPAAHMDFGLFKKIVREASTFRNPPSIGLNFAGESLLYPRFADALIVLKELGLSANAGFNTNGMLLGTDTAHMLLDLFAGTINISLDGFKASHEAIRAGSSYEKVFQNTMYLLDRRKARNATRPRILVNLTKAGQPESEIKAFVDYWTRLADQVNVYEQLSADNALVTTNQYLNRALATQKKSCLWPWKYLAVLSDGTVTFCCHDIQGRGGGINGSLNTHTALQIWRGRDFRRVRHWLLTGKWSKIPACRRCEAWAEQFVSEDLSTEDYLVHHGGTKVSYQRKERGKNGLDRDAPRPESGSARSNCPGATATRRV